MKAHRKALSGMTGRANEPLVQDLMRTVITVTLRSLNEDGDIYREGARAYASANRVTQRFPLAIPSDAFPLIA